MILMTPKILVLDTETTGVEPPIHVVEVAWCEVEADDLGIVYEYESLINPGVPIPCDAAGLSGIRDADVQDAPHIDELPWPDGPVIVVCHNVAFDLPLVADYMNVVGSLCTMQLARRLLPTSPNHKLPTLACYCDLPKQIQHRALGDVRNTLGILDCMAEMYDQTVLQFVEYMKKPMLIKTMPFGKHKGMPLEDLPKSYVLWLQGINLDPDLEYSLNRIYPRILP